MVFSFFRNLFRRKRSPILGKELRRRVLDGRLLEGMEQLFIEADLGIDTSHHLIERVEALYKRQSKLSWDELRDAIEEELVKLLDEVDSSQIELQAGAPTVLFIVGVNGNGKTTSVAKLARRFQQEGRKVLLGGADTFRAAAGDQLDLWAKRLGVDIVKQQHGADPAAVVHDAVSAAVARKVDLLLVDTAGRLHTKKELMQELEKMRRVASRLVPGAPHYTLLVLDATTGQNGLEQAKTFHQSTPISGLILTKMDGTAKGGIAVAIQRELGIPIQYVGVGEQAEDLKPFNRRDYARSLLGR